MAIECVCLDASVLIAVFQEEAGRVQDSVAVLRAIRAGSLRAVCPTLILTEVRLPPRWSAPSVTLTDYLRDAHILLRALDVVVAERLTQVAATDLRGKYFRDQVYVATALVVGATHLFTWDDDHIRHVKNSPAANGVIVCHPVPPDGQLSLRL